MIILIFSIWLLCGVIAVWRLYHGDLKGWYELTGQSYWDFDKERGGDSAIRFLLHISPIFILGGLVTLIISEANPYPYCPTWWFTTKNKKNENS